jgi:hypothetical protein
MISELLSMNDGICHVIGPLPLSTLNVQVAFWPPQHCSTAELQLEIGNNAPNHRNLLRKEYRHLAVREPPPSQYQSCSYSGVNR